MNQVTSLVVAAALLSSASLAQVLARQDLIGVSFDGNAITLDSRSGVGRLLGPTGHTGHNCMARAGRLLYTVERIGSGTSAQYFLDTVDDVTGVASRSVPLTRDLRGLASGGQFALLAIAENGGNDQLVRVDVRDGSITVIGSTGFGAIQGLTLHNGTFYGWDLNAGLLRIDFLTGVATDVDVNVGNQGAGIQFLTTTSDGRVLGGQDLLFEIDVATGVATRVGRGLFSDLRGVEERFGVTYVFGVGCANVHLNLSGAPSPGSTITATSSGNLAGAAGTMLVGFSDFSYLGVPLPLRLDPFLGTANCFLNISSEFALGSTVGSLGLMQGSVRIPTTMAGLIFHVQHVSLSNAPGGLAFSEGGTVRVRL